MAIIPERIHLANVPTRIEKLEKFSRQLGTELYIKRDDQTGAEFAGNKIRKLEFSLQEALNGGFDSIITCGGIQSNHCRATAAAAARLGLKCDLVLRGSEMAERDGNLLLDDLLGAKIHFITPEQYRFERQSIMEEIKEQLILQGYHPYIIPEGASNGIGSFGYYVAMQEILAQEKQLGLSFDAIIVAVGSGGTYAGLFLATKLLEVEKTIYGFNVCEDSEYFREVISGILEESQDYLHAPFTFSPDELKIVDGYVGRGYALGRPEERQLIRELATLEGIVLDPVYTGKAFYGLTEEIKGGRFKEHKNILFIHTGGLFGLFPQHNEFA